LPPNQLVTKLVAVAALPSTKMTDCPAPMLVMPLSGYLGSSFTKYPIVFFGTKLPHWGWDSPVLKDLCSSIHHTAAVTLMALIALHVAAALKHRLIDRDAVFARMWTWRRSTD